MFGASQFKFTGGRSRPRPTDLGARRYGPRGAVRDVMTGPGGRGHSQPYRVPIPGPSSRGCPSFSNFGPSRLSARDTWRPQFRGPCCKSCWGAPLCGRQLYLLAPLDAPRGADGLARVKFLLAHLSDPHVGPCRVPAGAS